MNNVPEAFKDWLKEAAPVSISDVTQWVELNALDEHEPLAAAYPWLMKLLKDRTIKILPGDPNHLRFALVNYVPKRQPPKPTPVQSTLPE